jgi:hypothetical protein
MFHFAAEMVAHELHSVADSECGNAEFEEGGIRLGGVFSVNAGGAAGEDDAFGGELFDLLGWGIKGDDLRIDFAFANPARDDLGVLRPEIEDEEAAVGGLGGHGQLATGRGVGDGGVFASRDVKRALSSDPALKFGADGRFVAGQFGFTPGHGEEESRGS